MGGPGSGGGRPPFEWTEEKISRLKDLALLPGHIVNSTDIGRILGCSRPVILRFCEKEFGCSFFDYRRQRIAELKSRIFFTQVDMALKSKDRTMLIWLGKCLLGQSETLHQEQTVKVVDTTNAKKEQVLAEVREILGTIKECTETPLSLPASSTINLN